MSPTPSPCAEGALALPLQIHVSHRFLEISIACLPFF